MMKVMRIHHHSLILDILLTPSDPVRIHLFLSHPLLRLILGSGAKGPSLMVELRTTLEASHLLKRGPPHFFPYHLVHLGQFYASKHLTSTPFNPQHLPNNYLHLLRRIPNGKLRNQSHPLPPNIVVYKDGSMKVNLAHHRRRTKAHPHLMIPHRVLERR